MPTGKDRVPPVVVEAEAFKTIDKVVNSVQIPGDTELYSWDQVELLIAAIREAVQLVFRDKPGSDDEYDAAYQELMQRAAYPQDVNRLFGAVTRFRRAALALDADVTR